MIIGLIHVFVQDFNWCPVGTTYNCIGPSLRWNPTDFLFAGNGPLQGGWGAVIFTFAIDVFFALWGPVALGYLTILQHIQGHTWEVLSASWPRVFFWFMFLGLFSAMGYAGNLGIIVGFYCVVVACMALAITLGGGAHTRTHLEFHVHHFFTKQQVTVVHGGVTNPPRFELA